MQQRLHDAEVMKVRKGKRPHRHGSGGREQEVERGAKGGLFRSGGKQELNPGKKQFIFRGSGADQEGGPTCRGGERRQRSEGGWLRNLSIKRS